MKEYISVILSHLAVVMEAMETLSICERSHYQRQFLVTMSVYK